MKRLFIPVAFILLLVSCKQANEPVIDYCAQMLSDLNSKSFKGTIFICNAQPPEMAFWPGEVMVSLVDDHNVTIHLTSDLMNFDTILQYKIKCHVVELTGTCNTLFDENNVEKGGYNNEVKSIQFGFGYENCLNNTLFEGISEN